MPDYLHPRDFHRLARAISAPDLDTVHMMHSMNWVQEVKGASHLDLTLPEADTAKAAEVRAGAGAGAGAGARAAH